MHDPPDRAPVAPRRSPAPWFYDAVVTGLDRLGLARLRRELSRGLDGSVLEVGVGTGRQLPHHPASAQVTAVDPDGAALAVAARRSPGTRLVVATAEALPFDDASFDWVVVALALCTVGDPDAALREMRRVLRPGGRLRALEHVRSQHPTIARAQAVANPLWGAVAGGCRLDRPTRQLIVAAGFSLVSQQAHLGGHIVIIEATRGDWASGSARSRESSAPTNDGEAAPAEKVSS